MTRATRGRYRVIADSPLQRVFANNRSDWSTDLSFYELIRVYGSTFEVLINEEFGDGIMSAIDFDMDLSRYEYPKGDGVKITMVGHSYRWKVTSHYIPTYF